MNKIDNIENLIEVKNLSKTFRIYEDKKHTLRSLVADFFQQGKTQKFKVLNDISFGVKQGEFFGIIGRNGSGKSTLLKLLAGIYDPDRGSKIRINGKIVPFLELGVGFNYDLSGLENIYLNGLLLGMTREYINKKVKDIIKFAELEKFIETPVKNYSSGMLLRLGFSIAIQADADIYILDEILAVGDAIFQEKCVDIINQLRTQGKTIIFVSHDLSSIQKFCERVIFLENGKITFEGSSQEAVKKYLDSNEKIVSEQLLKDLKRGAERLKNKENAQKNYVIDKIEVIDTKSNKHTQELVTGESYIIRTHIKINNKKDILNCNIGFHSIEEQSLMFGLNTMWEGYTIDQSKDYIDLRIDNLSVNKGNYYLSAKLFGKEIEDTYDLMPFVFKLSVSNLNYSSTGLAIINHSWN